MRRALEVITRRILYLSVDGILQPLGFSQVARVAEGLARRGLPYALISLERPEDLASSRAVMVSEQLRAAGVEWTSFPYDKSGSVKAVGRNLAALGRECVRRVVGGNVALVHARGYPSALVAATLRGVGIPFVFDARGYWIDERLEEGRWFTHPVANLVARQLERQFFQRSAAVVTLTQLQADDVLAGQYGPPGERAIVNIPTCADFDDFAFGGASDPSAVPSEVRARLAGKLVLGMVGSINRSYRVIESLDLAARVMALRPDAHLLILSSQRAEYEQLLRDRAVESTRFTIASAPHHQMPAWLGLMHWGFLLLAEGKSKRGSMPTKLAEFLAVGVRPLQFGCNEEVGAWVRKAGSGIVLSSLSVAALDQAAQQVACAKDDLELRTNARTIAASHFSLQSGLERYDRLLRPLLERHG